MRKSTSLRQVLIEDIVAVCVQENITSSKLLKQYYITGSIEQSDQSVPVMNSKKRPIDVVGIVGNVRATDKKCDLIDLTIEKKQRDRRNEAGENLLAAKERADLLEAEELKSNFENDKEARMFALLNKQRKLDERSFEQRYLKQRKLDDQRNADLRADMKLSDEQRRREDREYHMDLLEKIQESSARQMKDSIDQMQNVTECIITKVIEGYKQETKQEHQQEIKQKVNGEVNTSQEKIIQHTRQSKFNDLGCKLFSDSPAELNNYVLVIQQVEIRLEFDRKFRLHRHLEQMYGHDGSKMMSKNKVSMSSFVPQKEIKSAVFFNNAFDCERVAKEYRLKGWPVETHYTKNNGNSTITLNNFSEGTTDLLFMLNSSELDPELYINHAIYYDYPGNFKIYINNLDIMSKASYHPMTVFTMVTDSTPDVSPLLDFLTKENHKFDRKVKPLEKPFPLAEVVKEQIISLPPTPTLEW